MINKLKRFFKKEKGQGLVEYGLILALISVLSIGVVSSVGESTKRTLEDITNSMSGLITTAEDQFEWVNLITDGTYMAKNEEGQGYYRYKGDAKEVVLPRSIRGHVLTNISHMFTDTDVEKVISDNSKIVVMGAMFHRSTAEKIDISMLNTKNVSSMAHMFMGSKATHISVGDFDIRHTSAMFQMFHGSNAESVDFSAFKLRKNSDIRELFKNSKVSEVYTHDAEDTARLNSLPDNPLGIVITTRP